MNKTQKNFIRIACNLHEHIIDYSMEDKEFEDTYGSTKEFMKKQISLLGDIK